MAKNEQDFKEMELWEHLSELRTRLIRAFCWVMLGLAIAWFVYPYVTGLMFSPVTKLMKERGWKFVFTQMTQGFMLQLQVSAIGGLIVALPLITMEIWGFIAPGLTRNERKACAVVFPLSIFFFGLGITTSYFIMEPAMRWFADFIPREGTVAPGVGTEIVVYQDPTKYILFMCKMMLAFGITFQLPLLLMFLCWIGLISSKMLKQQWRISTFGISVVAAIVVPSGDPISMIMLAVPLVLLYFMSIGLCRMVERVRDNRKNAASLSTSAT